MTRTPQIGSISSGTLRNVDLIQAFADELEDLIRGNGKTGMANESALKLVNEARDWLDQEEANSENDDLTNEQDDEHQSNGSELVNDLQDAPERIRPAIHLFRRQRRRWRMFRILACDRPARGRRAR